MSEGFDRRQALRLSMGTLAAAGLTAGFGAPAAAAARAGGRTGRGAPHHCAPPELPDVPGMAGDRTANEFWYAYDEELRFNAPPELAAAYQAVGEAFGGVAEEVAFHWLEQRQSQSYPRDFIAAWRPLRDPLTVMSRMQLGIVDRYYGCDPAGLARAFLDFGQGVLFDPRRPDGLQAHIMDGNPPAGYHIWHAYIRAMSLLGVDSVRWSWIDRLVGAGWHVQSLARPAGDRVNPPLPRHVLWKVRRTWLLRSPAEMDEAFESVPYPAGVG